MQDLNDHIWQKDEEILKCSQCTVLFSFVTRKHHCRSCGHIYCATCSNHFIKLSFEDYCTGIPNHLYTSQPARCCKPCYLRINQDNSVHNRTTDNNQNITSSSIPCVNTIEYTSYQPSRLYSITIPSDAVTGQKLKISIGNSTHTIIIPSTVKHGDILNVRANTNTNISTEVQTPAQIVDTIEFNNQLPFKIYVINVPPNVIPGEMVPVALGEHVYNIIIPRGAKHNDTIHVRANIIPQSKAITIINPTTTSSIIIDDDDIIIPISSMITAAEEKIEEEDDGSVNSILDEGYLECNECTYRNKLTRITCKLCQTKLDNR